MRIILQPFLSIRAASAVVNLPQSVLRRGCGEGGDRTGIGGDGELERKSTETVKKK